MIAQVRTLGKCLAAKGTVERLLPSVHAFMVIQMVTLGKSLVTI